MIAKRCANSRRRDVELLRGDAEALVREELRDEVRARVAGVPPAGARAVLAPAVRVDVRRHERARLELDQRRRHDEELAGDLDVDVVHARQEREILIGDLSDRDLRDVHLGAADQKQKQVERTLKSVERDAIVFLERHGEGPDP